MYFSCKISDRFSSKTVTNQNEYMLKKIIDFLWLNDLTRYRFKQEQTKIYYYFYQDYQKCDYDRSI